MTSVLKCFQADQHIFYAIHLSVITTAVLQLFHNLPIRVSHKHHKVTCSWAVRVPVFVYSEDLPSAVLPSAGDF